MLFLKKCQLSQCPGCHCRKQVIWLFQWAINGGFLMYLIVISVTLRWQSGFVNRLNHNSGSLSSPSLLPSDWADAATAAVLVVSRNGCICTFQHSREIFGQNRGLSVRCGKRADADLVSCIDTVSRPLSRHWAVPCLRNTRNVCLPAWRKQSGGVLMPRREEALSEIGVFFLSCRDFNQ